MSVRVSNITANFHPVILRLSNKIGPALFPFPVNCPDVRNANVQRTRKNTRTLRRRGDHVQLIVGRPATRVDDDPTIAKSYHRGVMFSNNFTAQHIAIKIARTILVGNDEQMRDDETLARRWKPPCVQLSRNE